MGAGGDPIAGRPWVGSGGRCPGRSSRRARRRRRLRPGGFRPRPEPRRRRATPSPSSTAGPRRSAGSGPASPARRVVGVGFDRDRLDEAGIEEADAVAAGHQRRQLEHPDRPGRPGDVRHRAGRGPHLRPSPRRDLRAARHPDRRHRAVDDRARAAPHPARRARRSSGSTRAPRSARRAARARRRGPATRCASSRSTGRPRVVAVTRLGVAQMPRPDLVVQDGDVVYVAVAGDRIDDVRRAPRRPGRPRRRALTASRRSPEAARSARSSPPSCTTAGHDVLLVEVDPDRRAGGPSRPASRPGCRGSWPTPARSASWPEADVDKADVVAAVTGDDEDNLVISLLAKQEFARAPRRGPGEQPEERVDVQRDVGRRRVGVDAAPAHRAGRGGRVGRQPRAPAVLRGRAGPGSPRSRWPTGSPADGQGDRRAGLPARLHGRRHPAQGPRGRPPGRHAAARRRRGARARHRPTPRKRCARS